MRFLTALLFLLSLLPAAAQTAPGVTLHDLSEAESLGNELYRNSGSTGLVLVVVRGNQVYFHGYGEAVPGSHAAPTRETVIRLCSLTKIFTTDLLTKLVSDGTVRLDDTLKKFAPEGAVVPEKDAPITLEELATHTAGLEREIGTAPRRTPHFSYPDYATRWFLARRDAFIVAKGTLVGVETVRTHARHIYRKLGVSTRRELRSTV